MSSGKDSLARRKQLVAVAVAGILLTVIFVPFQKADAFVVDLELPNVDDINQVPTEAIGSTFEVTIDVAAGELIYIDSVELILDNDESSVKRAIFNSSGHRTSGNSTLARGNLNITYSGSLTGGYGYGVGIVSDGSTFVPNYSFTFANTSGFISGNTGGSSYPVGNSVNGLVGPGTITISGKLNTALMGAGAHTLDVLINTGSGVNPDHLVAPQLAFTTIGNSNVKSSSVPTGNNVNSTATFPEGDVKVKFSKVINSGAAVYGRNANLNSLIQSYPGVFSSLNTDGSKAVFQFGTKTGITFGTVFDIDASSVELEPGGNYTLTVPYDETKLPGNLAEADVKLFHYNTATGVWSDITTGVNTVENYVTGVTDTLSPIATGYDDDDLQDDDDDDGGSSGGGGGGGGSRSVVITWPTAPTFDAEHFINFPLQRMLVANSAFVNAAGVSIDSAQVGQQVSIAGSFTNQQEAAQDYAFIVQVTDENGFVTDISWQQGTLQSGSTADVSTLWTPETESTFTVKIFVWNGVSAAPEPLSEVTVKNITVS